MKFRKLACTVLAGAAILGLAACGNSGGSKDAEALVAIAENRNHLVGIPSLHTRKNW